MVTQQSAIETAKQFVKECNSIGLDFHKVFLFGSIARNQIQEWSDIDLLLVSDQFSENVFENLKLFSKINIKYPIIETHPYPTNYYLKGDDFINEVKEDGIEIGLTS